MIQNLILFIFMFINWYGLFTQQREIAETVKPTVLSLIAIFYAFNTKLKYSGDYIVVFAFIFSLLGDIFLIWQDELFIFGLVSFAVAHIAFIYALFKQKRGETKQNDNGGSKILGTMFFYSFGIIMVNFMWEFIEEDLKIPVIVYTFLLGTMAVAGLMRKQYTNQKSYWYNLVGGILFIFSDGMLALGKFVFQSKQMKDTTFLGQNNHYVRTFVMVTYYLAQWFIFRGIEEHTLKIQKLETPKQQQQSNFKKQQ